MFPLPSGVLYPVVSRVCGRALSSPAARALPGPVAERLRRHCLSIVLNTRRQPLHEIRALDTRSVPRGMFRYRQATRQDRFAVLAATYRVRVRSTELLHLHVERDIQRVIVVRLRPDQ